MIVVCAIVAFLVAIIFPALAASKRAAKASVDASNLHQIGIVAKLYALDNDDLMSFDPVDFVKSNRLLPEMLVSQLDNSPMGFGNQVRKLGKWHNPVAKFRISYISAGDVHPYASVHDLEKTPADGWLVALNGTEWKGPEGYGVNMQFGGSFTRLRFDTSTKAFPLVLIDCTAPPYAKKMMWSFDWFWSDMPHECGS